jgi:uncharacterized protein (DUF2236 family)
VEGIAPSSRKTVLVFRARARMNTSHEHESRDSFFSPESTFWRVSREMIALLVGGRALLMQIAHPKVAAGVAEHSHFKEDPMSRLRRTMNTMWSITFDEAAAARASLERITAVHSKVRGVVATGEISFSGAPYDASDPELLLWVHATLIDSGMLAYDRFAKPLSPDEAELYYEDSKMFARLFDIPESMVPVSLEDFHEYMNAMITGDQIAVGSSARSLAKDILYPSPWLMKPAGPIFRLITAGLLPAQLRSGYGLAWDERRKRRFELAVRTIRTVRPFVPKPLRIVPHARAAERRKRLRA